MEDDVARRVAEIIPRYSMLTAGDEAGVAVSGGADSVVLLHILHRLGPQLGFGLRVLHVNHRLRGQESDEDEAFVSELAASLGLACLVERAPVGEGNLEEQARLGRRAFFLRSIGELGLKGVALGHTRSDQAETVLFRLLRGTGLTGLAGMQIVTADGLMRPLLTTSRTEVRRWAETEGLRWREDSSNAATGFARNRLRREVMPVLTAHFNSNLEAVLARTAEVARDEEGYWTDQIEPIYQGITKRSRWGLLLSTHELGRLHLAVQRRVVRRAIQAVRGEVRLLDREHVDAILRISFSGHGHDRVIAPGIDALRSFDQLLLRPPEESPAETRHYRKELQYDKPCELPFGAGWICVNRITPVAGNCANFKEDRGMSAEVLELNGELLCSGDGGPISLTVRNWQPGDQLHRPGHQHAEKIKTLFQEEQVLLWERRHWPVVLAGDEIIWTRQFGTGAKYAASAESRWRVRITYQERGV